MNRSGDKMKISMAATLQPSRRKLIVMALVISAVILIFYGIGFGYMLSVMYDVPFRVGGNFENGATHGTLSISPDGTTIVYDSPQTGHGDLYLVNADGTNLRRLTHDPEYEGIPAFSPDGKQIVFTREDHFCGHLWIMNADGSGQRQLTHGSDYDSDPCFSPDGKNIWFGRMPRGSRTISGFSTSVNEDHPVPVKMNGSSIVPWVSFTKKGDWVYYEQSTSGPVTGGIEDWEIWAAHADGSSGHSLGKGWDVTVLPEGSKLAFTDREFHEGLWTMNTDGTQKMKIYQFPGLIYVPHFSPDRRYIYFRMGADWGAVWRINTDGSDLRQITP